MRSLGALTRLNRCSYMFPSWLMVLPCLPETCPLQEGPPLCPSTRGGLWVRCCTSQAGEASCGGNWGPGSDHSSENGPSPSSVPLMSPLCSHFQLWPHLLSLLPVALAGGHPRDGEEAPPWGAACLERSPPFGNRCWGSNEPCVVGRLWPWTEVGASPGKQDREGWGSREGAPTARIHTADPACFLKGSETHPW